MTGAHLFATQHEGAIRFKRLRLASVRLRHQQAWRENSIASVFDKHREQ